MTLGDGSHNAQQIFTGCYFDSAAGTALIAHSASAMQVLLTGCKFIQNGAASVPVVQENDTTPAASVTIVGGQVAAGMQAFSYLVKGATTFTQVSDIVADGTNALAVTGGTVFDKTPGHASNIFKNGSALFQNTAGTTTGNATLFLVSIDLGFPGALSTLEGGNLIVYALVLNDFQNSGTGTTAFTFPHAFQLDSPILSSSPAIPGAFLTGIVLSKTTITLPNAHAQAYNGLILLQGS